MNTTTDPQAVVDEIRTAYADADPQLDVAIYANSMRCLSFLTSEWLTPDEAADAIEYIAEYGTLTPEAGARYLAEIADVDPDARVAIGREYSPVVYVETVDADAVIAVFNTVYGDTDRTPDELSIVRAGAVGKARKDLYGDGYDQMDPHQNCQHDRPPVPVSEYPDTDSDKQYVRAWWD